MPFRSSQPSTSDAKQTTSDSTTPTGPASTSRRVRRTRLRSRPPPAKPLSYDNYSTDTSSQFSADVIEVEKGPANVKVTKDLHAEDAV